MVEFAMTGAMLLLSVMWLLEVGLTYMATLELEGATQDIARLVRTKRASDLTVPADIIKPGNIATDNDKRAGQFRLRICERLVFGVGCSEKTLRVSVRSVDPLKKFKLSKLPADLFGDKTIVPIGMGKPNDFVVVNVFLKSPLSVFGKVRILSAAAVTQNEP